DPTMATPFFYWKGELTEVVVTGNKGSKSKSLSGNADAITVRAMGSEIPKNEEYYDKVFTEVRFLDPVTG
ncbi:hypothetical protein ACSTLL_23080, partial [Vibrio parahaemolyticus]